MKKKKQAIILGGGMAGMLTAKILSDHFEKVTIIEKDKLKGDGKPRKGVPQGNHLHILLAKGLEIIEGFFPGIREELIGKDAVLVDLGNDMKWYANGGFRPRFQSGIESVMMTRPLIEETIRERVFQLSNVFLQDEVTIDKLISSTDNKRIIGVKTSIGDFFADLVIDSMGRASRAVKWLTEIGYKEPKTERIRVNVNYTSCLFPRDPEMKTLINISATPPFDTKHGTIQPVENNRMIVMLQGRKNDESPKDTKSFKLYAKKLAVPDVYNLIKNLEPIGELSSYKILITRLIHFERMSRFPEGFLPIGDAICGLNPVYGQGMTSSSLQVNVLRELIEKRGNLDGIWQPYFKKVYSVVSVPWSTTATEDFGFPETEGDKPSMPAFLLKYMVKLGVVMNRDTEVYKSFLKVLNLLEKPIVLLHPKIMFGVLFDKKQNKKVMTADKGDTKYQIFTQASQQYDQHLT